MQTLPVEQLTSFLREAKDSGVFALYYIDLTTGLRRGELLGLKWSDIDLEKGDLRVQRQIGRIDGNGIEALSIPGSLSVRIERQRRETPENNSEQNPT